MAPVQTATAPDLARLARAEPEHAAKGADPQAPRATYQRALFRDMQPVTKIPVLPSADVRDAKPRPSRPRPQRRSHSDQQILDFTSPRIRTSLEAVLYCDAPVASPMHRALASALDVSIVLIAVGLFLVIFQFAGGVVTPDKRTLILSCFSACRVRTLQGQHGRNCNSSTSMVSRPRRANAPFACSRVASAFSPQDSVCFGRWWMKRS
jgi:hypothetical protein